MTDLETLWAPGLVAAASALWSVDLAEPRFQPLLEPADPKFGDAAASAAFKLAKDLKRPPAKIAQELAAALKDLPHLERATVAGPGYVNLTASPAYFAGLVEEIRRAGGEFGRGAPKGRRVQVEFVSANPTGPLHVAHARQAAVGDALANVLAFAGYSVQREFYVNDTGNQIEILGKSVWWRRQEALGKPYDFDRENAYQGEYVRELAEALPADADGPAAAAQFAKARLREEHERDLADFRVRYDEWYSQEKLEAGGRVKRLVESLKAKGLAYEKDGALWMKTKDFGDTDDKVLVKRDGAYTYRTPDLAYHEHKYERGFDAVIDLWGPDHHAHIGTMRAALKGVGHELVPWRDLEAAPASAKSFEVLLVQHCRVLRGGQEQKMSKRAGTFVTLREILDEAGADPMRWFLAGRKCESHLDFDLDVAVSKKLDNPAYYVQYSHARIASIHRKGVERGQVDEKEIAGGIWQGNADLSRLGAPEVNVLRHLRTLPRVVQSAAANLDPSLLAQHLYKLAEAYHGYYELGDRDAAMRVLCDDEPTRRMRLAVAAAFQTVARTCLRLLGISAPDRM